MDITLFTQARDKIIHQTPGQNGIGTLSEKTIHAVLKQYYVPEESCHEQKVAGFVADAFTGSEIVEIQTRNFNALRRKLEAYLPLYDVTIVYPIAHTRYLRYINPETGEITPPRKSPKTGRIYQIFPELYRIKPFLNDEHLHIRIALLDVEEFRFLDGRGTNKRKGATKSNAFPLDFVQETVLQSPADYIQLLPEGLPMPFSTKDYKKAAHVTQSLASVALNILLAMDIVERVGKTGNLYLYQLKVTGSNPSPDI